MTDQSKKRSWFQRIPLRWFGKRRKYRYTVLPPIEEILQEAFDHDARYRRVR